MDRLGLTAALTAALTAVVTAAIAGCAPGPSRVVARGTLAYAAAWQDERLVTVELAERFELVVRAGPALRVTARVDLGPPEADVTALAVAGPLAVVGGDDGWIRRFDLSATPPRELERWPQGAPITALAADADHVVAGDATGAVCLRRASGELLQCATRAATPIARLLLVGPPAHRDRGRAVAPARGVAGCRQRAAAEADGHAHAEPRARDLRPHAAVVHGVGFR